MEALSVGLLRPAPLIKPLSGVEIRERLKAYSFDEPGPYPYSKRLAKENEWPYGYALELIEEYRKMLELLATVDDQLLAPPDVEIAWRLHLIYSKNYFGMCNHVLGKRIEHVCDDGSQTPAQMRRRFNKTLSAYKQLFGKNPPESIWFEPDWHGLPAHRMLRRRIRNFLSPAPARAFAGIENIPEQHRALWEKIKNFAFDNPNAVYPYSARLADESFDGDRQEAWVAIGEYLKFLFLLAVSGHWVTPSLDVDEAWHLHLDFTPSYWDEMMGKILGKPLHHHPGNGSAEDETKFQAIYQRTLHDYGRYFGEPPFKTWGKLDPSINWEKVLEGTGF